MSQAGKPRTVTSTLTSPDEPIDLGSLGMLLYFLLGQNQPKAATSGTFAIPGAAAGGVGAGATGTTGAGGMNPLQLMKILTALGGGR